MGGRKRATVCAEDWHPTAVFRFNVPAQRVAANIVRTSARREIKAHGIYLKEAADRLLAAGSGPVCPQRRTWRWVGFSAKWILSGLPIIRSEPDATFPRTVSGQLRGHLGRDRLKLCTSGRRSTQSPIRVSQNALYGRQRPLSFRTRLGKREEVWIRRWRLRRVGSRLDSSRSDRCGSATSESRSSLFASLSQRGVGANALMKHGNLSANSANAVAA
jgi:hypothetical protein